MWIWRPLKNHNDDKDLGIWVLDTYLDIDDFKPQGLVLYTNNLDHGEQDATHEILRPLRPILQVNKVPLFGTSS